MDPIEVVIYLPSDQAVTILLTLLAGVIVIKIIWKLAELIPGM